MRNLRLEIDGPVQHGHQKGSPGFVLNSACGAVDDRFSPPRTQLDCLDPGYLAGLHGESQHGTDKVPALMTTGSGIHVKQSRRGIPHDLQNMGVTADEQTRPEPTEFLSNSPVVIARIPADVGHVHIDALAFPEKILRQIGTKFGTIDVPVNATHRFEGSEPIEYFACAEVSRVPHLITLGKVMEDSVIQKAVGVGKQPDPHSPSYAASRFRVMKAMQSS